MFLANLPAAHSWALLTACALSTPLGIGLGWALTSGESGSSSDSSSSSTTQAVVIALSSGSFLYISLCELLPSALADGRSPGAKLGCFLVGYLAMAALAVYA